MDLNAKAQVEITPLGGQIIPFVLILISAAFFSVSIWLDMENRSYVLPASGAVVCLIIAVTLYVMSRRDTDLQKSHAFGIALGTGATQLSISADPRSLPALDYLRGILLHWSVLLERQPLPEASGTIDQAGRPVPDSVAAACEITREANKVAQSQVDNFATQLPNPAPGPGVAKPSIGFPKVE